LIVLVGELGEHEPGSHVVGFGAKWSSPAVAYSA
jgi:hypothetical protein